MTTSMPIPEVPQFFTHTEAASLGTAPEPAEQFLLADAEEEEFAELWAADRGNQGA